MIQEGQPAPDFELTSDSGEQVKLSDFRGKPVVLYFYPKDDTPGCTAQACGIRDSYETFGERAAVVAAPAAGARSLAPLASRHQGPLVSVLTVSPPPSVAARHPMRWSHWTSAQRALTAATFAAYSGEALIGLRSLRDRAGVARD